MRFRVVLVCTVLVGCQIDSTEDVDDVDYEAIAKQEKVTICHKPSGANPQTLEVAGPAVSAHLGHGDYLGECQPVICAAGSTTNCYGGPMGTSGVGTCVAGTQTCNASGTGYGACAGSVEPAPEVCGDGADSDCDGFVDEGCVCAPGSTASCYTGPAGTEGVGRCSAGTQTCDAIGMGYGACVGSIEPAPEACGDGSDSDCDGSVDEGCVCTPGSTASCYEGPAGTLGVGTCSSGSQTCNANGTGYSACAGSIEPAPETCGDGIDTDCDGFIDETCVCTPGALAPCYDGPPGTEGVGTCSDGFTSCNGDGLGYGSCLHPILPTPDICGDHLDTDCDGLVDETCVCTPGALESCYDGPPGTEGVGICAAGFHACVGDGSGFGTCTHAVKPVAEVCGDGVDNDCDGHVDEGCIGDRAWIDRNLDGIQNPGEAGIVGATFLLRTASGALVAVATSNAAGTYYFSNVPAGSYYVEAIPPVGFVPTTMDVGTNDSVDSDFDPDEGASAVFAFPANGTNYSIDCGIVSTIQP